MTLIKGYMVPFWQIMYNITLDKVEKILKGSLDSIPSPSPLVKIFVNNSQQCFAFISQANFPAHNLKFH